MATNLDFGKTFNASIMNAVKYKMDFDENKLREDMRIAREEARNEVLDKRYDDALLEAEDDERKAEKLAAQKVIDDDTQQQFTNKLNTDKAKRELGAYNADMKNNALNYKVTEFNLKEKETALTKKNELETSTKKIQQVIRDATSSLVSGRTFGHFDDNVDKALRYIQNTLSPKEMAYALDNKLFTPMAEAREKYIADDVPELDIWSKIGQAPSQYQGGVMSYLFSKMGNQRTVDDFNKLNEGKLTKSEIKKLWDFSQGISKFNKY